MRIKLVVDIQSDDLSAITDLIGQQTAATFMQHIIDRADMATESDDHGDEQACSVIITDVLPSGEVHVFQGDSDAQVKLDDGTLRTVKVVRA